MRLADVLTEARRRTLALIVKPPPPPPPPPPPLPPDAVTLTGTRDDVLARLRHELPNGTVEVTYRVLGDGQR